MIARIKAAPIAEFRKVPLPALAEIQGGDSVILLKIEDENLKPRYLIQRGDAERPEVWTEAEAAEKFAGRLLLMTSLWLANVRTGKSWQLLASSPSDEMTANLAAMWKPQFSLDGKAVYVMAEAWVTSSAIHRIDIASAQHRFIIDGELLNIEATGKYRGYLFVRKRRYLPGPDYGTDYPLYYIRPDGKRSVMIPDSAE